MSQATPVNILLVDDYEDNLVALEAILADLGQNLVRAMSGQEALRQLLLRDFAVVLLDVRMPDMDGFEIATLIRERQQSRHTPIIFVTGIDTQESHVLKGYSMGGVDYILKPFNPEILKSKVKVFVDLFKMTRQVKSQTELLQKNNEELKLEIQARLRAERERKRLIEEMVEVGEKEQRRIGQDLHDGLCQHLTGIEFMSKVLEEKLLRKSLPEATAAAKISELIHQAITQTRDLVRGMVPLELETGGLVSALQILAANTESLFGIQCKFSEADSAVVQDASVATHLYRIAQETVNNAVKHSHAGSVTIGLSAAESILTLSVQDDGVGLTATHDRGMGLRNIRHRAELIGAVLEIRKNPGGGTTVLCSLPKKEKLEEVRK